MTIADLSEYRRKRDFGKTSEPDGSTHLASAGPLRFAVQKHRATALHYDLRLEAAGVLKSFAVPKGPSLDPSVKRRAQQTEDHPLEYLRFEGSIPRGEYGAGNMIIWDAGTYSPDEKGEYAWDDREAASARILDEIEAGKVSFTLRGSRLKGSWTLVRTKDGWLLIKHADAAVRAGEEIAETALTSVASGLSLDDLAAGRSPVATLPAVSPADTRQAKLRPLPGPFRPMLAQAADRVFDDPDWFYEPKLDGIRCLAFVDHGEVRLFTRNKNEITAAYPRIAAALARQPCATAVIDGEIVALDEAGRPSFEALQQRMNLAEQRQVATADAAVPVIYFAFDLVYLDGYDLAALPIEDRRRFLQQFLVPAHPVSLVEAIDADGPTAYDAAVSLGFEGIVAKRRGSTYQPGRRSPSWRKIKHRNADEFIIGGFTAGEGGRASSFGGLLLGTPLDDGKLRFRGRVGTGFSDGLLQAIRARLDDLVVDASPFADQVPDAERTIFVRPDLVAEVEFAEVTSGGILRAPVFRGLRTDKEAAEVRMVTPETAASDNAAVEAVLRQLESPRKGFELQVGPHALGVTNLDKELWPPFGGRRGYTKRDYLRYLATVSPVLLEHIRDRPLTLTRFPDGIEGNSFYQRHWEQKDMPLFVEFITMFSETNGGDRPFLLCNNLPTPLWLGQLADLELHASLARVSPEPDAAGAATTFAGDKATVENSVLNYPDYLLFDLDPYIYAGTEKRGDEPQYNREAFAATCDVALKLRELLAGLKLSAYIKTSGATGLHIYVPIIRNLQYGDVRALATTVATELLSRDPRHVTLEWATDRRTGKVFVDVNQNARIKSLACQYSPRAKPGAPVSVPLRWDELGKRYPDEFTIETVPARLAEVGDIWSGILAAKVDLAQLLGIQG